MIRILIVDDDALVRAGLTMILQSADDLQVVGEARDGSEVIEAVQRHRPDVVLMDIRMPQLDGLAATAALQLTPHPPRVIVLTISLLARRTISRPIQKLIAGIDDVTRAREAGFAAHLTKPVDLNLLVATIRRVAVDDSTGDDSA